MSAPALAGSASFPPSPQTMSAPGPTAKALARSFPSVPVAEQPSPTVVENSDVTSGAPPEPSAVAVALTRRPRADSPGNVSTNDATPAPSVVASNAPRNVSPSPLPDGSGAELANSSMRNGVAG